MASTCPECGAGAPETEATSGFCATCGREWSEDVRRAPPLRGAWHFDLRPAAERGVTGPLDRIELREQLYTGELQGTEQVREVGGSTWQVLGTLPEFAGILRLVGRGEAAAGNRRLGGWQAVPTEDVEAATDVAPPPEQASPSRGLVALGIAALVLLLGLTVLALVALAWLR